MAAPLPYLIYRLVTPATRSGGAALHVPFYRGLADIAGSTDNTEKESTKHWQILLPVLVWLSLLLAAAKPVWLGEAVQVQGSGRDLMMGCRPVRQYGN